MEPKLKKLNVVMEDMDHDTRHSFYSFLVGSLSVDIDNDKWDFSIKTALECVEKYCKGEKNATS